MLLIPNFVTDVWQLLPMIAESAPKCGAKFCVWFAKHPEGNSTT